MRRYHLFEKHASLIQLKGIRQRHQQQAIRGPNLRCKFPEFSPLGNLLVGGVRQLKQKQLLATTQYQGPRTGVLRPERVSSWCVQACGAHQLHGLPLFKYIVINQEECEEQGTTFLQGQILIVKCD